jgi:hypothetical protein
MMEKLPISTAVSKACSVRPGTYIKAPVFSIVWAFWRIYILPAQIGRHTGTVAKKLYIVFPSTLKAPGILPKKLLWP